ncbi:hypothetical protein QTP70_023702 [Hemibagrus guttatus]|uniref:Dynein heavy chain tail domain-containing protein n=1 Tax=Hemibagrus guttatus TaxID=175788 RepID=A0AAE0UR44_9TELE|nr:hypothetical protein QTP70_023702 [Hemibagrus guttatus]
MAKSIQLIVDSIFMMQHVSRYCSTSEQISLLFIKHYKSNREDPPLCRNMCPTAARILWVRNLFNKIQEPMSNIKLNKKLTFYLIPRERKLCRCTTELLLSFRTDEYPTGCRH